MEPNCAPATVPLQDLEGALERGDHVTAVVCDPAGLDPSMRDHSELQTAVASVTAPDESCGRRLTDQPGTGTYRTAVSLNVRRGYVIPRADVAHAILVALAGDAMIGHVLGLGN